LHKRVIDLLSTVQCNGEQAFAVPYLVGAGSPITVVGTWTSAWSSATTAVEYFQASSNDAKQQLVTYNEDFGITSSGLSAEWYAQMDDAVLLPLTVYAATPGESSARLASSRPIRCIASCVAPFLSHHRRRLIMAAYNVPELIDAGLTLVLSMETIAAIYLEFVLQHNPLFLPSPRPVPLF
jgi:hypothetical protein